MGRSVNTTGETNAHRKYQALKALPGISKTDLETKINDEGFKGWRYVNMAVLGTNNWLIFERIITK